MKKIYIIGGSFLGVIFLLAAIGAASGPSSSAHATDSQPDMVVTIHTEASSSSTSYEPSSSSPTMSDSSYSSGGDTVY